MTKPKPPQHGHETSAAKQMSLVQFQCQADGINRDFQAGANTQCHQTKTTTQFNPVLFVIMNFVTKQLYNNKYYLYSFKDIRNVFVYTFILYEQASSDSGRKKSP